MPTETNLEKQKLLNILKDQILQFKDLEIAKNCINPVIGEGNPNSDIIFIGEAPGATEDQTGKPFAGRSGKLLNELLNSIKLEREQVYITNIVKFRPPKNRDPNKQEKEKCIPFLISEIQIIKPKLICTLGRHSLNFFMPNITISNAHGKLFDTEFQNNKIKLFPLYHPAAALYNPNQKETLFKDFTKLAKIINGL